jgi:ABC-type antimicrobial peptide transport system permease subunit
MALGASQSQVLHSVLSRTALLVAIGTTIGLTLALGAGKAFEQILYGVSARDPLTYVVAIGFMAVVAFLACLVPARRAMGVAPLTALRTE